MIFEKITEDNIRYAFRIQGELFPGQSARTNYEESVAGITDYEYYLVYEDGTCVGIVGIYHYPVDPESGWLGWFGIREEFRRKHLGSAVLRRFEEMAADRGYRFARLYTDAVDNDAAIAFYRANGYTSEPYRNADDPACIKYPTLIFSKLLASETSDPPAQETSNPMAQETSDPPAQDPAKMQDPAKAPGPGTLVPWNSRSIHLTEQIAKQERGRMIRDGLETGSVRPDPV